MHKREDMVATSKSSEVGSGVKERPPEEKETTQIGRILLSVGRNRRHSHRLVAASDFRTGTACRKQKSPEPTLHNQDFITGT